MPLLPTRWSSADARWKSMSQTYSRNWDYRRRRLTTDECLQCFVMSSLRACLLNPDLLRGAETTTGYVVVLGSTTNTTVVLRLAGRRLDHRSRRPGFKRHTLAARLRLHRCGLAEIGQLALDDLRNEQQAALQLAGRRERDLLGDTLVVDRLEVVVDRVRSRLPRVDRLQEDVRRVERLRRVGRGRAAPLGLVVLVERRHRRVGRADRQRAGAGQKRAGGRRAGRSG